MKIESLHLAAGFLITTSHVIYTAARPVLKHTLQARQESFPPTSRGSQIFTSHSSGYSTSSQMTPDGIVSKTATLYGGHPITTTQTFQSAPGIGGNPTITSQTFQSLPGTTLNPAGGLLPNMAGIFNGPMVPSSLPPIPALNIPLLDNPLKSSGLTPPFMFPPEAANAQMQALNTLMALPGATPLMLLPTAGTPTLTPNPTPSLVALNALPVQPQASKTPLSTLNSPTSGVPADTNSLTQTFGVSNAPSNLVTLTPAASPQPATNTPNNRVSNVLAQALDLPTQNPNKTVQSVDTLPSTSNVVNGVQDVRTAPNAVPSLTPTAPLLASNTSQITHNPPHSIGIGNGPLSTVNSLKQPEAVPAPALTAPVPATTTTTTPIPASTPQDNNTSTGQDSQQTRQAPNPNDSSETTTFRPPENFTQSSLASNQNTLESNQTSPGSTQTTPASIQTSLGSNQTALTPDPTETRPSSSTITSPNPNTAGTGRSPGRGGRVNSAATTRPANFPVLALPAMTNNGNTASPQAQPRVTPLVPLIPNNPSRHNATITSSAKVSDTQPPVPLHLSPDSDSQISPVIFKTNIPGLWPSSFEGVVEIYTFSPSDVNAPLA